VCVPAAEAEAAAPIRIRVKPAERASGRTVVKAIGKPHVADKVPSGSSTPPTPPSSGIGLTPI